MSTSGSSNFNLSANEIIVEAFDLIGVGSEGEPISADLYNRDRATYDALVATI